MLLEHKNAIVYSRYLHDPCSWVLLSFFTRTRQRPSPKIRAGTLRTSGTRDKRRTQRGGARVTKKNAPKYLKTLFPSRGLEFEDMRRWPTDNGFVDALPAR